MWQKNRHRVKGAPLDLEKIEVRFDERQPKPHRNTTRRFIAWDGEATKDAGYCLFGNSEGDYVCAPELGTVEMLDLVLRSGTEHGDAFHVAFAFDYDVNNILKDLPWMHLIVLKERGRVIWNGYRIEHIPHKIFKVARGKDKVRIDDIFSWFRSRYDKALDKYKVASPTIRKAITAGKDKREDFHWSDIKEITAYWKLELATMPELMNKVRRDINAAGYFIGDWYGPGALAAYALRSHNSRTAKYPTPDYLLLPCRMAYAGGWFERFKIGVHAGPIWTADLNSAYAYAMSLLPNLNAEWRHIQNPTQQQIREMRFGVVHIRWKFPPAVYLATCRGLPLPLWIREKDGQIQHPPTGEGWYWNPEAALTTKMNHPDWFEYVEAYELMDDGSYPFDWVQDDFNMRLALQAANDPAEKGIKWMLASLYGRQAQRAGWNRKDKTAPYWHQIEFAGWITSKCRSMVCEAAWHVAKQGGLISIDTDGVTSTVPFENLPNGVGNQLGRWTIEEYKGIIFIQNGIYFLRDGDGNWLPPKLRGIPNNKLSHPSQAIEALEGDGIIHLERRGFVGYHQAAEGRRDEWRTWKELPSEIHILKSGKRQHIEWLCRACKAGRPIAGNLHDVGLIPQRSILSSPHQLPWLPEYAETEEQRFQDKLDKEIQRW